jgi:hypothetical protein
MEPGKSMKHSISHFVALMAALVAVLVISGCASAGPGGGDVTTLKQIDMRVEWPMSRFRNAVSFGRVTLGGEQQVNQAYAAYKTAFAAAIKAANSNDKAAAPDNVKQLADQVLLAINSAEM